MKAQCNRCRYAVRDKLVGDTYLFCHLMPPTPLSPGDGSTSFAFAAVHPTSWCGQFRLAWTRLFKGHISKGHVAS